VPILEDFVDSFSEEQRKRGQWHGFEFKNVVIKAEDMAQIDSEATELPTRDDQDY